MFFCNLFLLKEIIFTIQFDFIYKKIIFTTLIWKIIFTILFEKSLILFGEKKVLGFNFIKKNDFYVFIKYWNQFLLKEMVLV